MKIYCDFTGIYANEAKENDIRADLSGIDGTNGYCSKEAASKIKDKIKNFGIGNLNITDNGNHHYMSLFWLKKIKEPFDLVVFDHHTDMRQSPLTSMLSCGNWLLSAIQDENIPISKVYLIGPPETDFKTVKDNYKKNIVFLSESDAKELAWKIRLQKFQTSAKPAFNMDFPGAFARSRPVYISMDKDILKEEEIKVNWDQGNMKLGEIEALISLICHKRKIIGMDLCGEPDINSRDFSAQIKKSRKIDEELADLLNLR